MKMKGFFKRKEKVEDCIKCGLHRQCETPKQDVFGRGKKGILIISECPSATEDETGEHYVGEASNFLLDCIESLGINPERDCWKINAVRCRPPSGDVKDKHVLHCKPFAKRVIQELQPKHIWLLGKAAVHATIKNKIGRMSIGGLRGLHIPDYEYGAYIHPMYHPNYMIRNERDRNLKSIFLRDFENTINFCQEHDELPPKLDITNVKCLYTVEEIEKEFKYIFDKKKRTAFDFETSALKPHRHGHKIHTVSIAHHKYTIAFPYMYPGHFNKEEKAFVKELLIRYVTDPELLKIAHNLKFETGWCLANLGVEPQGVAWCTKVNQHILDSRDKGNNTGLKTLAYLNYGVHGWEKETKKYYPDNASDNDSNDIHKMPLPDLLQYNGVDSLITLKEYARQLRIFNEEKDLNNARQLFHEATLAFSDMEFFGIHMDVAYIKSKTKELEENQKILLKEIRDNVAVKKYEKRYGVFEPSKAANTTKLFLEIMGLSSDRKTKKGADSTDAAALTEWAKQVPIAAKILEWRKTDKIRGTYLQSFARETVDGYMHPFFNLSNVDTGRSSGQSPNFHNIPVRNKEAKKACRSAIIPRKGNHILETDFGSLEVRIIACYTRCPNLVRYIQDTTTDMHRDQAIACFMLDTYDKNHKEGDKALRNVAKSFYVFPSFYGSYYKNTARNLWDNSAKIKLSTGLFVHEHLFAKGISCYEDFVEHIRSHESTFWEEFSAVRAWQERVKQEFIENGYTTSFFGYRRTGHLSPNDVINAPIQATAFHCLLWCLVQLNKTRKKEGWKSLIIGQIHDSIVMDVCPSELEHVKKVIQNLMVTQLSKKHKWMIVPMEAEMEMTGIDQPWYTKEIVK